MLPNRVLVIGASGQLGQSFQKIQQNYPNFHFVFVDRSVLELSSLESIEGYFSDKQFDYVINAAAYTAVDKAESEVESADKINHLAVAKLAEIAKQNNFSLIHVSTDYVFNGLSFKPYQEMDETDPQNSYGLTKLKGEQAVLEHQPKGAIIRTSWVYSEFGQNFVKTMLRLGKERDSLGIVSDQVGSPTYAPDLAVAIMEILQQPEKLSKVQLFHFTNEGVCSWYDFAKTIFQNMDITCSVSAIETKDYPTPAKRPFYSVLNKNKIKATFRLEIPYWQDSLKKCLKELSE